MPPIHFQDFKILLIRLLLLIITICGIWLMVASHQQKQGKAINLQRARVIQKTIVVCVIAFAVSFGLCSAWYFLPLFSSLVWGLV